MEPGEGALDDPAVAAEPGAVLALAAGDFGRNTPPPELAAVLLVVVAAIGGETLGTAPRAADPASYGRDGVDERDQLGDVIAVAAREPPSERDPGRVDQEVVLGAVSGSIYRARARLGAPFFACTWLASQTARDHSISPAARNRASSKAC